ncbi:MAG TPA: hypothetical protein PKD54_03605 [Pirellulaceae bacterium]|nr:hypothetical protein [Pirellulaceae bacterium]
MQKVLCIIAMTISSIVFLLFAADLVFGMLGVNSLTPFRYANFWIDVVFAICAGAIAVLSWMTYKQQR